MTARRIQTQDFLATTDWQSATPEPITGDASARRYWRLIGPRPSAILMDAPPEFDLKTQAFVDLAQHLNAIGLSAPQILAADIANGFLILEDLGTAQVYNRAPANFEAEQTLYAHLADIALHLWDNPPTMPLPRFDAAAMTDQMGLFADWYCTHTPGSDAVAAVELIETVSQRLAAHLSTKTGLIHRDYHVQNMLFLPGRPGLADIGLIDFQDAMLSAQAYDIASLLTDARQDVSPALRRATLDHVTEKTARDADDLALEFALCALQRNLRIIGIFARLSVRDGKPHYPTLLPRVWAYVEEALDNPNLKDLRALFNRAATPPAPDIITHLQAGRAP